MRLPCFFCWTTLNVVSVLLAQHDSKLIQGWTHRPQQHRRKYANHHHGTLYSIGTCTALYDHHHHQQQEQEPPLEEKTSMPSQYPSSSTTSSLDIPIPILYESDSVLAIHKPPNIAHHDTTTTTGILNHIRSLQKTTTTTIETPHQQQQVPSFPYQGRIYGVHRLDRVTSGILLLAKTKQAAQSLTTAFRNGDVTKYYVALSSHKARKKKQGWVRGDMVRSRRKSWRLSETKENPAITRFFTKGLGEVVGCDAGGSGATCKTLVLFRPYTGKTHQLRVAGKSLGLPILGDEVYGGGGGNGDAVQRTYLHATALHVCLDGEDVTVWCPPFWFDHFRGNDNDDDDDHRKKTGDEDPLHTVLLDLMRKHCDNDHIRDLVVSNATMSF